MNSIAQKNILYAVIVLVGLIAMTLIIFASSDEEPKEYAVAKSENDAAKIATLSATNTIASEWRWEAEELNDGNSQKSSSSNKPLNNKSIDDEILNQSNTGSAFPFTQESVYKALHAVKLNDNGDIILDDEALNALNTALDHSELKLDAEALAALQNIIRKGLPGNAGEQTAQIVADYYQYLGAKKEFNSLYETYNSSDQNITRYEDQYNELLALREQYLGAEAASQLFATANANSRYMFEIMKLEENASLSAEEKEQERALIIERHAETTTQVNNWNERYQSFMDDKQYIINSSLSNDEKRDQLQALMRDHFSQQELEYVSHLQLDSLR